MIVTRFEMFGFAGIGVLTLRNQTEESGERYAITVDYATKGMASVFVDLTTHAEARGRLNPGSAQPEWFRDDSRRNGAERLSRVDYRPDGTVDVASMPPLSGANAGGRDARHGRQSDRLLHARAPARPANRQLRADRARLRRPPRLRSGFRGRRAGGAVAGGRPEIRGQRHRLPHDAPSSARHPAPEKDEGARQGTIWYARLIPGDLMVPVRMQMDTQLGIVDGYLAELHGQGVDLTLME